MDAVAPSVLQNEFPIGSTEVASRDPHPALRPFVTAYWGYIERFTTHVRRRELPSSDVVLILSFGPELWLKDARDPGTLQAHTSFVAGLTEASVVTEMDGRSHGMQINFTPLGAHMLLDIPMWTIANRVVALEEVVGGRAGELLERLYETNAWAGRFDILDAVLLARLARARPPAPSVAWAWRRLTSSEGRISVQALTTEIGCSRRHLVSRFREQIGLTPKLAARVLRFQRAARVLERRNGDRLLDVARDCGYYDQAHFNRDFKHFSGSTPTEFVARQIPGGLGVAPE